MKPKVGILISGRGSNMMALVEAARAHDCPYEVVLVASDNPDAPGIFWANAQGVPTFTQSPKGLSKLDYEAWIDDALRARAVQFVALAGYMRLLSDAFVGRWRDRIVNIHPALLPKYGGKGMYRHHVHEAVIAAKEKESGITIHFVDELYDHGQTIFQASCIIEDNDTPGTLAQKVHWLEHEHFPRIIEDILTDQNTGVDPRPGCTQKNVKPALTAPKFPDLVVISLLKLTLGSFYP